jgi:hypothetical protein
MATLIKCLLLAIPYSFAFSLWPTPYRRLVGFRRIASPSHYPVAVGEPLLERIEGDSDDDEDDDNDIIDWQSLSAELVSEDEDDGLNDGEWLPDRVKALERKERARMYAEKVVTDTADEVDVSSGTSTSSSSANKSKPTTAYTEEEEEVIAAMGGKTRHPGRRREAGFIGDSTLAEIATDYSVPISYLADVLCMWGVPVPINVHETLGNLVTGEQAFAIVEAVNTLDVSTLHDRYSNTNVRQLCYEWDIDLQQAFEMIMREGWSLPFGVQTCLRVEQERELLRILGGQSNKLELSEDEYNDDF